MVRKFTYQPKYKPSEELAAVIGKSTRTRAQANKAFWEKLKGIRGYKSGEMVYCTQVNNKNVPQIDKNAVWNANTKLGDAIYEFLTAGHQGKSIKCMAKGGLPTLMSKHLDQVN
jgi:hypothetical protein